MTDTGQQTDNRAEPVFVGSGMAAKMLGVSYPTIRTMASRGNFPGLFRLPSGQLRIPIKDIEAWRNGARPVASEDDAAVAADA